jgi:hypothetical protein
MNFLKRLWLKWRRIELHPGSGEWKSEYLGFVPGGELFCHNPDGTVEKLGTIPGRHIYCSSPKKS